MEVQWGYIGAIYPMERNHTDCCEYREWKVISTDPHNSIDCTRQIVIFINMTGVCLIIIDINYNGV